MRGRHNGAHERGFRPAYASNRFRQIRPGPAAVLREMDLAVARADPDHARSDRRLEIEETAIQ